MTKTAPYRALTLGLHANRRGMGWVAFSGPFSPFDWGTVSTKGRDKNVRCLRKVERLLDRLTPETVVLEAFERQNSARRDRITKLGRAIVALAISKGIDVAIYTFGEVRSCFDSIGAGTRQEIAEAVARQISAFVHLRPRRRKAWDAESGRMPLFSAAALTLTYYQRSALTFLSDLTSST